MSEIPIAEARDRLAELVNRAAFGKERIVLSRRGREIAAIVPLEDVELLARLDDLRDLEEGRAALEEATSDGTVPWQEIKSRLGL